MKCEANSDSLKRGRPSSLGFVQIRSSVVRPTTEGEVLKLACGRVGVAPPDWGMKQDHKSPDYTTFWGRRRWPATEFWVWRKQIDLPSAYGGAFEELCRFLFLAIGLADHQKLHPEGFGLGRELHHGGSAWRFDRD